jgi:hypothetical protein
VISTPAIPKKRGAAGEDCAHWSSLLNVAATTRQAVDRPRRFCNSARGLQALFQVTSGRHFRPRALLANSPAPVSFPAKVSAKFACTFWQKGV